MRETLASIHRLCRELSAQHRLSMPRPMVRDRLDVMVATADDVLQDRVIKMLFLLDQHGVLRYNELRRLLGNISTRTLAQKLAFLQGRGFVSRTVEGGPPPVIAYRITPDGRRFIDLLFPALVDLVQRENLVEA